MNVQHETTNALQITSYSTDEIQINNKIYSNSVIIRENEVFDWRINTITELDNPENLKDLLRKNIPVIIGHNHGVIPTPSTLLQEAIKYNCSIELMTIGAACRTFNILQLDERPVIIGVII